MEQRRDTEAHQIVRQDPDYRAMEQQQHSEAHYRPGSINLPFSNYGTRSRINTRVNSQDLLDFLDTSAQKMKLNISGFFYHFQETEHISKLNNTIHNLSITN